METQEVMIARVAHEINRAYCESLGDDSQVPWREAPQWQKDSAIEGVRMHLSNPQATPEDSHKRWLAKKEADGWVWGEVKDADAKTHPCMVPFDQLPQAQQSKDYIFRAVVHALGHRLTGAQRFELRESRSLRERRSRT